MNKQELKFILQNKEGLKTEFKENISGIDKEIVAFANTEGGRIFVGITDKSKIKGIKITNKLKSQIQDIARNCDPPIDFKIEEFGNILIIKIKESENKPHKCSSGFYSRQGANSQKMTRDEILDFAIGEGKIRFDEQVNKDFRFPQDFDKKKLDKYLKLAGITKNIKEKNILINLGVAALEKDKVRFNSAGILFFAKDIERLFLTSKVICVNYRTDEKVDILDKKVFDNGIIGNIQEAINYVQKHINVKYEIKALKRKEIPQYPKEAIRESIVNAIMHRDYFDASGDILIEIFRTKIDFSNPGGLVSWLDKKDFGKRSRARNKIIANLLSKTEFVEKVGTGINRIRTSMKEAGLPEPLFDFDEHNFSVLLKSNKTVGKTVGKTVKKILFLIDENPKITREELSKKTDLTIRGVEWNLARLKQKGLLKRIGPDKGGHWEIIDNVV